MTIEEYTELGYSEPGTTPEEAEAFLALAEEVVFRLTRGRSAELLSGGDQEKALLVKAATAAQCFCFLQEGVPDGCPTVCRRTMFLLERAGIYQG